MGPLSEMSYWSPGMLLAARSLYPETSIGTSIVRKKDTQGIPPLKRKNGKGVAQSDLEKAEEFNGQFTDVFSKNEHT